MRTSERFVGPRLRVLLVEDRIPDARLGSGYGRMIDTIAELQAMGGVHVALYPTLGIEDSERVLVPAGVQLVDVALADHFDWLRSLGGNYSAVIVSRPHNYEQVAPLIHEHLPGVPVIYDAEAIYFRRIERQADLATGAVREALLAEAAEMRALEEAIAADVDAVVCIADDEAALFAGKTKRPVIVNGPLLTQVSWTDPGYDEREGIGFIAGWSAGSQSPNVDGLRWFARHIWPRVLARVPGVQLLVTGDDPPREVRRFECESITFLGAVGDLTEFYGRLRLAIVPIRYGSGVKLKAVEALQSGVPTVATSIGAENIPIDVPGLLPITDDEGAFAEHTAALYQDRAAWESKRDLLAEQRRIWSSHPQRSIWPDLFDQILSPASSGRGR